MSVITIGLLTMTFSFIIIEFIRIRILLIRITYHVVNITNTTVYTRARNILNILPCRKVLTF